MPSANTVIGDVTGNLVQVGGNVQGGVHYHLLLPKRAMQTVAILLIVLIVSSSAPAASGPANASQPFRTAYPIGHALAIEVQAIDSISYSGGFAFPVERQDQASRFQAVALTNGISPNLHNQALADGAYLVGGVRLVFTLSSNERDVRVFRVRALATPEPVVTGMAFREVWPSGSPVDEFAERAGVLLDSEVRDARMISDEEVLLPTPYLDKRRVPVGQEVSPQFVLDLHARQRAYQFKVEIQYTAAGVAFSQLVDLDGHPFRATADLCQTRQLSTLTPAEVVQRLAEQRYLAVLVPDRRPGATPNAFTSEAPDAFAERCRRQ